MAYTRQHVRHYKKPGRLASRAGPWFHERVGKALHWLDGLVARAFRWLDGPLPRWTLLLGVIGSLAFFGARAAFGTWWPFGAGDDPLTRRWEHLDARKPSPLYTELVNPHCWTPSERLLSTGCSDAPRPVPRHGDWREPHVSVYSFRASAPPPPTPTLRDPGDRGQAEAIGFLAKAGTADRDSVAMLQDALNDSGAADSEEDDPFRFNRILVTTVVKGASWNPGDRMMWTRVFVQPINFSFIGYTVAETKNATVNVATVEAAKSRKIGANLEAAVPGVEGAKASVDPESERNVKTSSDVAAPYEQLGIDIMPNFLRVIRESERGSDVEGNALVSLSLVTDPLTIQKRSPSDDTPREPRGDDIVLRVTQTHLDDKAAPWVNVEPQVPVPHCALRARVWMLYEERKVDDKGESYEEGKHDVTLVDDAEDKQDIVIMNADEVSPAIWSIHLCGDEKCTENDNRALRAHVEDGSPRELVFSKYRTATEFIAWLRKTYIEKHKPVSLATTSGNLMLDYPVYRYYPNYSEELRTLVPVKKVNTKDECGPFPTPEQALEIRRLLEFSAATQADDWPFPTQE